MTLLKGMISQMREIFTCRMGAWVMGGRDTPRKEKRFLLSRNRRVDFPQGYPKGKDGSSVVTIKLA